MASRLELNDKLTSILATEDVYFQPPESIEMHYPAIVYQLNTMDVKHADNRKYAGMTGYQVTLIDYDPDSSFVSEIHQMRYCQFDRFFTTNNLNHWVFTLYF